MKFAIVFSAENKRVAGLDPDQSSPYEKMAIGLAYSIREHLPDVDVYCGNFTNNKLSATARIWFKKLKINYIEELIFNDIGADQSFMFLRTFTKDYFAKTLLDKYDYLLYLDVDVVLLGKPQFDFDPTQPLVLVDTMPQWVLNYHRQYLKDLNGPLYYNWIDIVNQHNKYIFDLDYTDSYVLHKHNADVLMSNRITDSTLPRIEQHIGGYHCLKPITPEHTFYHYDNFGEEGTLYSIEPMHPEQYKKYINFFKQALNIKFSSDTDRTGHWDRIAEEFK